MVDKNSIYQNEAGERTCARLLCLLQVRATCRYRSTQTGFSPIGIREKEQLSAVFSYIMFTEQSMCNFLIALRNNKIKDNVFVFLEIIPREPLWIDLAILKESRKMICLKKNT